MLRFTYKWYYMPTSVHVILIHGFGIIQEHFLPIGILSKEAQENFLSNLNLFQIEILVIVIFDFIFSEVFIYYV